ncbi:MAG: hypothetical protein ACREQB_12290 [Candidatus Binataceae bacterium]
MALAICGGVVASGCAAPLPGTALPPARFIMPARGFPGLRDYRGVVDFRLRASGVSQVDAAELALKSQIDFVFLADRADSTDDYGTGGFTNQILFVAGASFATGTSGTEVLGLNLTSPVDSKLGVADLIAAIRNQGALAAIAGASRIESAADYSLADALEIYNLGALWNERGESSLYVSALFLGADRFFKRFDARPIRELSAYDRMAANAHVTLLAGMGGARAMSVLGASVGTSAQRMLVFTTHVLARERQVGPVVDALKRGNSYVSFDILGYVSDFGFYARRGEERAMMGEEMELAPGVAVRAELPEVAQRIVMFADGIEVASAENAAQIEFAPSVAGAYRVEAYRSGLPWIYSNPVYLR